MMPEEDFNPATVIQRRIIYFLEEFHVAEKIDAKLLEAGLRGQATSLEAVSLDYLADSVAVRFRKHLACTRLESESFHYPRDWWEHFKARWAPTRFLKRWPVVHKHITYQPLQAWADIEIPKGHRGKLLQIHHWEESDESTIFTRADRLMP